MHLRRFQDLINIGASGNLKVLFQSVKFSTTAIAYPIVLWYLLVLASHTSLNAMESDLEADSSVGIQTFVVAVLNSEDSFSHYPLQKVSLACCEQVETLALQDPFRPVLQKRLSFHRLLTKLVLARLTG